MDHDYPACPQGAFLPCVEQRCSLMMTSPIVCHWRNAHRRPMGRDRDINGRGRVGLSGIEGKPTLLVTDITLGGGMDGWLARNQWPDIGLLFIIGENQRHQQYHHLLQEVFLLKPFRGPIFLPRSLRWLARRHHA